MVQQVPLVPVDSGWGQFCPPDNTISQAEAAELDRLNSASRALDRAKRELRESIVQRLLQGARVEAGPISPHLTTQEVRRYSRDALKELLGNESEEALHQQLIPKTSNRLTLRRDGNAKQSSHTPQPSRAPLIIRTQSTLSSNEHLLSDG